MGWLAAWGPPVFPGDRDEAAPSGEVARASAADRAHAALGLLEERAVDEVARLLAPHRGAQQLGDLLVARAARASRGGSRTP